MQPLQASQKDIEKIVIAISHLCAVKQKCKRIQRIELGDPRLRIFGTRTKECNCHHSQSLRYAPRRCYNRAANTIFGKNLELHPAVLADQREKTAFRGILMKRLIRSAAMVLLVLAVTLALAADKAKSLYNKGKDAEARQNYEQAYDYYKQAYDLKPTELTYRSAFDRLRFLAGASHVHRGQLLREAGQLDAALAEFQKAAEIDPSSAIAQQEFQHTKQMIEAAKAAGPRRPPLLRAACRSAWQEAAGPVELATISNVPINLKITEDSKVIYETVGKLAGINVLFDPDYTSRRIKIELNNVSLEEALEIIALESKTFWRPVTPNTIFVAADNPAKRKDLEQSVIKTFYLANLSQPTELQDVVNAMRQILEISRIQPLPSQSAIVVRGTPDQIALAQKLVGDLDKAKAEVIVDVAITADQPRQVEHPGHQPTHQRHRRPAEQPHNTTTTEPLPTTGMHHRHDSTRPPARPTSST